MQAFGGGTNIPLVSCIVCATEVSKNEAEDIIVNMRCLDEHLDSHGLKRIEVPPDGHCIIHSWRMGLKETSTDLLHLGVTEILNNLAFLPNEDLRRQLEAYALLHNYHSAVVDLMVHALANATSTTCVVTWSVNSAPFLLFCVIGLSMLRNVSQLIVAHCARA